MTRYEIESRMDQVAHDVMTEYGIIDHDYYGDCYPREIATLENKIAYARNNEEIEALFEEARDVFRGAAVGYIAWMEEEK